MVEPRRVADEAVKQGYEGADLSPLKAGLWGYGLLAVVVVMVAVVFGLWRLLVRLTPRPPASPVEATRVVPPEPRLQTDPQGDLARFRAAEQQKLDGLGWVDQGRGIAHIPVDRAMRILAQKGWPGAGPGVEPGGGQGGTK